MLRYPSSDDRIEITLSSNAAASCEFNGIHQHSGFRIGKYVFGTAVKPHYTNTRENILLAAATSRSLQTGFGRVSLKTEIQRIQKVCPPEKQKLSAQFITLLKLGLPYQSLPKPSFWGLEPAGRASRGAPPTQKPCQAPGAADGCSFRAPAWSTGISPGAACEHHHESDLLPKERKAKKNPGMLLFPSNHFISISTVFQFSLLSFLILLHFLHYHFIVT